jgi:hypothetical protein
MSVIERTLRATSIRRAEAKKRSFVDREKRLSPRPSQPRDSRPSSSRSRDDRAADEVVLPDFRVDEKVEFLTERIAQLQQKVEAEKEEKIRTKETLTTLRKKVSTIALDNEKQTHDLRRAHAEELMMLEVSVEERMARDLEARTAAVQKDLRAQQDQTVHERAAECEKAFVQADILRARLAQERQHTEELRAQHEEAVASFLSELEQETSRTRLEALAQSEDALRHYQTLAQETVESARQERHRLQKESLHASHLAETACLSFEEEVQARTREIIDEYRRLSREAQAEAATEQQSLRARLLALEQTMEEQRLELDRRVEREIGRRLEHYSETVKQKQEKLHNLRMDFQKVVTELLQEVEQNCKNFEAETKQKAIEVIGRWTRVAEDLRGVMDDERQSATVRELRWISMLQSSEKR